MSYKYTRLTTFIISYLICFEIAIIGIHSNDYPSVIAIKLLLAAFAGFFLSTLAWKFIRARYLKNLSDRLMVSKMDIKNIWAIARTIPISKEMDYMDLYVTAYGIHDRAAKSSTRVNHELFHLSIAAILKCYLTLWEDKRQIDDKEIIDAINYYTGAIEIIKHHTDPLH